MSNSNESLPLWTHKFNRRKRMSAVVDEEGRVVCGSYIVRQRSDWIIDQHARIVDAVNTATIRGTLMVEASEQDATRDAAAALWGEEDA